MTEKVTSDNGAEPQPSATQDDARIDELVKESLGEHYVPLDESAPEPSATETEEEKTPSSEEPKPTEAAKPAPEAKETTNEEAERKPEEDVELPPIPKPEMPASRLDKRVATLYVQNLLLSGEKEVPSLDEVINDLRKYPMEQKIDALHFHRTRQKELKGIRPTGREELEPEDSEAIRDAERESIRQEVIAEEHERQVKRSFVEFLGAHPELNESAKEYQPTLARAVETLWRGGMPIQDALETVTKQIDAVKESFEKTTKKERQAALSGAISASGDAKPAHPDGPSWEEMAQLMTSDPDEWERLIKSGYTPKG